MPFFNNLYTDFPGQLGPDVAVGDILSLISCDGAGSLDVQQNGDLTYTEAPADAGMKVTCQLNITDEDPCNCTDDFDVCVNVPDKCIDVCLSYLRENDPGDVGYGHYALGAAEQSPNPQNYNYSDSVCVIPVQTLYLSVGLTSLGNYQVMPVTIEPGMAPVQWMGHSVALCEAVSCGSAPECRACDLGIFPCVNNPRVVEVMGSLSGSNVCRPWLEGEVASVGFLPTASACHWVYEAQHPTEDCKLIGAMSITETGISVFFRMVNEACDVITSALYNITCPSIECSRTYTLELITQSGATVSWSGALTAVYGPSHPPPTVPCGSPAFEAVDDEYTAIVEQQTCHDIVANDIGFSAPDVTLSNAGGGTATGTIVFNDTTGEICYTAPEAECGTDVTVNYEVVNTITADMDTATVLIHVTTHDIPATTCSNMPTGVPALPFTDPNICWDFPGWLPAEADDFNCFIAGLGGPAGNFSGNEIYSGPGGTMSLSQSREHYALANGCHMFRRYPGQSDNHVQIIAVNGCHQSGCVISGVDRYLDPNRCYGIRVIGCADAMAGDWYNTIDWANIVNLSAVSGPPILHVYIASGQWELASRQGDPSVASIRASTPFTPGAFTIDIEYAPRTDSNGYYKVWIDGILLEEYHGPVTPTNNTCPTDPGTVVAGDFRFGLYSSSGGLPAQGAEVVICDSTLYNVTRAPVCQYCEAGTEGDPCDNFQVPFEVSGVQEGTSTDARVAWAINNHWILTSDSMWADATCTWRRLDVIPPSEGGGGTVETIAAYTAGGVTLHTEIRDNIGFLLGQADYSSPCLPPYECDRGYGMTQDSSSGDPAVIDWSGATTASINNPAGPGICN